MFLFQFYITVISSHALFLSVNQFITCIHSDWRECSVFSPPATIIMILFLVFEALLFAIFTLVMFITQLQAIWIDETVSIYVLCLLKISLSSEQKNTLGTWPVWKIHKLQGQIYYLKIRPECETDSYSTNLILKQIDLKAIELTKPDLREKPTSQSADRQIRISVI